MLGVVFLGVGFAFELGSGSRGWGDSIVHGRVLLDQDELATSRVAGLLPERDVEVANVAAGSWGPPNLLAFLEVHGSLDARRRIRVWS